MYTTQQKEEHTSKQLKNNKMLQAILDIDGTHREKEFLSSNFQNTDDSHSVTKRNVNPLLWELGLWM